ncbi:type I phosphodiesterase/nucleotide pyrophosphatase [Diaminobutyricimonas aerilata]|uniref:Type I phosphodiesterase/nucleotide pyrophosphatase n=1 Tax=Diaminobutyricimonas aerilata TaxID=1162967 RepID=A0A2M9CKD8_9MICO|nr:nucleotide pyrophosphatase/phosphodiesterase family protein [Diaminobutyricimonas aerilata]PJJ72363.1 type I phosphodiesterase/nucleotide pyrophosphatase [Diaminobutyricimonas aerilata]
MLPARPSHRFSLADVLPDSLEAVRGRPNRLGLPRVSKVVVLLVDGMGAANLRGASGYARTLASASSRTIASTFPSTTASALATLTTGVLPGRHGLVGYSVYDSARDRVVNQLTGWDDGMRPLDWQAEPTVFERATAEGMSAFVVGHPKFSASGYTAAVLRGAQYQGAATLDERVSTTRRLLDRMDRGVVYLYVPELDKAGHDSGTASDRWLATLEDIDAAVTRLASSLRRDEGLLVTADHGMVDVSGEDHVIADVALLEGVRHVAGEPRCVQLVVEQGADASAVAERWRAAVGSRAWVAERREVVDAGWFGPVDDSVLDRIGDVLVLARGRTAVYADPDDPGRGMIGQHGSITPDEASVPLLAFGAFAPR